MARMTDDQVLKTIEMSRDASARFARGEILSDQPASECFQWLERMNLFECAVVVPKRTLLQKLFRSPEPAWPQVVMGPDEFRVALPMFEATALSGFRLIVGVKSGVDDLVAFFAGLGYRLEGRGVYGSGDPHDPTSATWSKAALQRGVSLASRLCRSPLCVFAHDADPVYLLYKPQP
jgi:hypothetical protein